MKRVVVTGARGGIGSAAVAEFENRGWEVLGIDVDDEPQAVLAGIERIDAIFCAHGGSGRRFGDGPVDVCTDEGWERTIDLNLTSVFRYCRLGLPLLRANGGGAIVTLSSVLALGSDADFPTHAYTAAKGALVSLTRAMAITYAHDRIRCNVVCAGLVKTPMSARAQADERVRARLPELQPLTADFLPPRAVAEAAVYLAEAEHVTGTVLAVDAGWSAR